MRNPQKQVTPAPRHLSPDARKLWRAIVAEFAIDDAAGLAILRAALDAYDLAATAATAIAADGPTFRDRWNQTRAHPLLPVLRDQRAAFLAALKQLGLDVAPVRDRTGRPPKAVDLHFAPGAVRTGRG